MAARPAGTVFMIATRARTRSDLPDQDALGQAIVEGDHDIATGFLAAIHGTLATPV